MGVGLAGHELQGEQAKASPAFVISNIEVTNPEKYQKPQSRLRPVSPFSYVGQGRKEGPRMCANGHDEYGRTADEHRTCRAVGSAKADLRRWRAGSVKCN